MGVCDGDAGEQQAGSAYGLPGTSLASGARGDAALVGGQLA